MTTLSPSPAGPTDPGLMADELFRDRLDGIAIRTDRLFAVLLGCQWAAAIATALLNSPRAWAGESSGVHPHVWAATLLGGAVVVPPIALALARAGASSTRQVIAIAQALMGALLIHLSGGRNETHFHIFGSMALLAFYRDWRVLVTASVVATLDHMIRGLCWPQSVFGIAEAGPWRWAEHAGWLAVEDVFLIRSCLQNVAEMRDVAGREADLARANEGLSREVAERRRAEQAQARMAAILDATTDFVAIADVDARVLHVNPAGRRMIGLGESEAPPAVLRDCFARPAGEVLADSGLPAAIRDGAWSGEVALLRLDGGEVAVSMVILAHRDAGGGVEFLSAIARDVSGRKRAELELLRAHCELEDRVAERTADLSRANQGLSREVAERRRAEQAQARMAAILDATTDFVAIADAGGRALYVNPAGRRMIGLGEGEVAATAIRDSYPGWVRPIIDGEALPASIRDGVWSGEVALLGPEGGEVPVSMVALAHRDARGEVEFFSTIARDVADRERAGREIRLLNSQLELRLNRLDALRRIDTAITSSFDLTATLSTLLDQALSQLGVDAADVMLIDPGTRTLGHVAGRGFRTDSMRRGPVALDRGMVGLVARGGTPLHLPDLARAAHPFNRAEAIAEEGFVAYSAVPLISRGVTQGVLEVFHRSPIDADAEWRDFLEALARQAAIAIDSARLFEDLQSSNAELTSAYDATIEGWARALDLRDKETEGHTRRVTEMAVRLARSMGLGGADLINLRRGALLHDIGKLGVPDSVLLKPGKLTDEEWTLMRRHPTYAHEWLSPIAFLRPALEIPHCHHEKWDGTGYPRGLRGEEIPKAARIFAAVDIWDALRSERPYRSGWPEGRVIEHIRSLSGTHLEPAVVDALLRFQAAGPADPEEEASTVDAASTGEHECHAFAFDYALPGLAGIVAGRCGSLPEAGPPTSSAADPAGTPGTAGPRRPGLTILVAEDHAQSARVLRRALEAEGHEVVVAADGEEAWGVVEEGRARVVIADWVMPGLDGPDLCRRIRARVGRPYIYVILLTGRAGAEDRLSALSAGADDLLAKPLDPRQLNARLEVARRIFDSSRELERSNARLAELATTDDLTGLKNRRHFRESLESSFSAAARQGLTLSLILFDVDHFKSLNDAHGHPAGDEALRALAAIVHDQIRPSDHLARHGGEEFVLILPATDADGARAVGERLRAAIAGHPWPLHPVTASFGIATIPPDCVSARDLVDEADTALYHSKKHGRNLVTHFDDLPPTAAATAEAPGPARAGPDPDRAGARDPSPRVPDGDGDGVEVVPAGCRGDDLRCPDVAAIGP